MKNYFLTILVGTLLLAACTPPTTSTPVAILPADIPTDIPTQIPTSTPTPLPQGNTIIVTSTSESGPGSLRQALQNAQPYDNITFDPTVFPPDMPVTISLVSPLQELNMGNLTIDASNAGVILDGSAITGERNGFTISSDGNTIRGLQVVNFPNAGIGINSGAQHNVIGGDRNLGSGPLGQGNLVSGNGSFGIGLWDRGTSNNTIQGNHIGVNLEASDVWGHPRDGIHSNGASGNLITDNVIGGNDNGVYLCCVAEGKNVVTTNIIGTDPTGANHLGNQTAGVIVDHSNHNVIGPGNLIAYNDGSGVMFWGETSGNTVTENMIHDNNSLAIGVDSFSNQRPLPPIILDFDLQAGTLTGVACANCTVEIFSGSDDEGAVYEGQAKTKEDGTFTFEKGAPLAGPSLAATVTDPAGTTSQYSTPTEGASWSLSLQRGDYFGVTEFQTRPSSELNDNRIGGVAGAQYIGDWVWKTGLKWFHMIPDPDGRWQYVDWEKDEYSIDTKEDQVVDDLLAHKIKIMLVLDVWNIENRVVYDKTEEDIAIYLSWVRFMVRHFKGRIEYYEILNEPDMSFDSPSGMPVDAYVKLVKRTVPVIREEDPDAKIVVGSAPDTRFNDCRDWMWGVLNSEVMPLVDGISWHGMFGAAPSDDPRGVRDGGSRQMANYWENYPAFIEEIKSAATSNGFKGEFFDEDMLWRTPSWPHQSEPYGFTDISGAKYFARAIAMHLGLDVTTGLAVVQQDDRQRSNSVIRTLSTVMAGAQPVDLPVVIESEASNIKYYGFALSDGVKLLALWTDGAAVEYDPGIPITLTFPGFSAESVTGLDVLYGFEQQIVTENEDGNLVIHGLLVKDYPVILRLTP
jgi:hypothetical protein